MLSKCNVLQVSYGKRTFITFNFLLRTVNIVPLLIFNSIGGSRGGACPAHAHPYGTQFFRFRIHFHRKVPMSEVHTPPNRCTPPLREILDPPLNRFHAVRPMSSLVNLCMNNVTLNAHREKNTCSTQTLVSENVFIPFGQ